MVIRNTLFIFLLLLTSCSHKKSTKTNNGVPFGTSLFIEMPENLTVFENIGPIVYESLWSHFQRVGFNIVSKKSSDFIFKTKIISLENIERFVSPDVLPYSYKVSISLECSLFDKNKLVSSKEFNFFKWIRRPSDPALSWTYLQDQYRELLERSAPRIEYFFRTFILLEK